MAEQDVIKIARNVFDAWNAHDPERYMKCLAQEYVSESDTTAMPVRGPEAARQVMQGFLAGLPDLRFEIQGAVASGEIATMRWLATGTHRGELMGVAPTQRRVQASGCSVLQIQNGRVTHQWLYWDTGHLLRQLGVLPERSMAAGR